MESTHYGFYNYQADYCQAHLENAQHASQPETGQTSGASTANTRVDLQFLAGLEKYAQGVPLEDCSATLNFKDCVTDYGELTREGRALCGVLSSGEQKRVKRALASRRECYYGPSKAVQKRILAALKRYEQGIPLEMCSREYWINLNRYITDDGYLQPGRGQSLFNSLSGDDKNLLIDALRSTRAAQRNRAREPFLASLENYARGVSLEECSRHISISRYMTDDGHLQPGEGESLYGSLRKNNKDRVDKALTTRREMRREVRGSHLMYLQRREVGDHHSTYRG
ncbi:MAG: hypothetical protein P8X74_23480 [Reinekea sp.]